MNYKNIVFNATGTVWEITVPEAEDISTISNVVQNLLNSYENDFSRFKESSLISKLSTLPGEYKFPDYSKDLINLYLRLYRDTNKKFTFLIGNNLNQVGYTNNYNFVQSALTKNRSMDYYLQIDFPKVFIKHPIFLDFGAGGKGFAIDLVVRKLKEINVKSFTVDAGGDIYTHNRPITVGLEHPMDTTKVIGTIKINNNSICGSATNRRVFGQFSHIINPSSLKSPKNIIASWVVAKNALLADCLSTCLFLVKPSVLHKYIFSYLNFYKDSNILKSRNFKATLF